MAKYNIRQIKIYSKYRTGQSGYLGKSGKDVPWLSLSGIWLERAGFNVGDYVRIVSYSGLLLIERLDPYHQEQESDTIDFYKILKKLVQ